MSKSYHVKELLRLGEIFVVNRCEYFMENKSILRTFSQTKILVVLIKIVWRHWMNSKIHKISKGKR